MPAITEDGINFTISPGTVLRVVGLDEIILPHFLVRTINTYNSILGSDPRYLDRCWHTMQEDMPGWVGRTYRDFIEFCYEGCEDNEEFQEALQFSNWDHEIVEVVGEPNVYRNS